MDARSDLLSWATGRPIGLALLSFEVVHSADSVGELADGITQDRSWAKPFLRYDETYFYRYYVDSDAFFRDVVRAVYGDKAGQGIILAAELLRRIPSWPQGRLQRVLAKVPQEELRREACSSRRTFSLLLSRQVRAIARGGDDEVDLNWPELAKNPSIQYFFQCLVPCYLHFSISPQKLFSLATAADRPDLTALRKLVKLDKRVIYHPAVREVVNQRERATRRRRQDVVGSALRAYLPKLSSKAVKERIGGALSKVSEGFGKRTSATEIQQLFDLVRRIRTDGRDLRDRDLPPSPDAYRKRVDVARNKLQIPGLDGCEF